MMVAKSCRGSFNSTVGGNVYLHSVVNVFANPLLEPFLQHYAGLGVRLQTHAHIVLHQRDPVTDADEAAMSHAILARYGLTAAQEIAGQFSTKIRMALINKFIKTLPSNAWVINSDSDEHFHYPCDVTNWMFLVRGVALCGMMQERVAPNLELSPIVEGASLENQFPLCSNVVQNAVKLVKLTLLPARFGETPPQYIDAHTVVIMRDGIMNSTYGRRGKIGGRTQWGCRGTGPFPHYAATAVQARLIWLKMAQERSGTAVDTDRKQLVRYQRPRSTNGTWRLRHADHSRRHCGLSPPPLLSSSRCGCLKARQRARFVGKNLID